MSCATDSSEKKRGPTAHSPCCPGEVPDDFHRVREEQGWPSPACRRSATRFPKTACPAFGASLPDGLTFFTGMARRLRYVPPGGALVEVTCRTIQGRLLLRPSAGLNDVICLGASLGASLLSLQTSAWVPASYHCKLPKQLDLQSKHSSARDLGGTSWIDSGANRRSPGISVSLL